MDPGGFSSNLEDLFARMSNVDTADGDVDFNSDAFMSEMQNALGREYDDNSSEEGSSFYGDYPEEDGKP